MNPTRLRRTHHKNNYIKRKLHIYICVLTGVFVGRAPCSNLHTGASNLAKKYLSWFRLTCKGLAVVCAHQWVETGSSNMWRQFCFLFHSRISICINKKVQCIFYFSYTLCNCVFRSTFRPRYYLWRFNAGHRVFFCSVLNAVLCWITTTFVPRAQLCVGRSHTLRSLWCSVHPIAQSYTVDRKLPFQDYLRRGNNVS